MEQRRTVEIGLFGVLTSFFIALAALAVGQSGKPPMDATVRFAEASSILLVLLYIAVVIKIERLNRRDRRIYGPIEEALFGSNETPHPLDESKLQVVRRGWAAWPILPAVGIEIGLLLLLESLN